MGRLMNTDTFVWGEESIKICWDGFSFLTVVKVSLGYVENNSLF